MRRPGVALAAVLALAPPLAGQGPEDRVALTAFRASLDTITIERDLVRLREQLRATVRASEDDLALLRLGHVWLRLAEVADNPAGFGAARSAFEEVSDRRPDWPLAWDGVAESAYGEHVNASVLITGLAEMFGSDPARRLARHYVRAVEADTSHADGLRALGARAERSSDETLRNTALAALRLAAVWPVAADRDLRLARARLERDSGVLDSALVQLEELVRVEPAAADALLELARLRFVLGRDDGLTAWYAGLEAADSAVYAAYRRDLALVFNAGALARLDSAAPAQRPAIARREWQRQDPDGLPIVGDRLRDHYRRFDFARTYYQLRREPRGTDPLDWAGSFDARGRIYVRHGRPAVRTSLGRHGGPEVDASLRIVGAPPNETWRYGPADESAYLFHFVVREPGGDFTLAESALDILALTNQYRMFRTEDVPVGVPFDSLPPPIKTYGAELVSMVAQELLMSRQAAHPLYGEMLRQGKGGAEALQHVERAIGRASVESPAQWSLRYELPLDAQITVVAADQADGHPQLQVAFAIAGSALLPIHTPRGVAYQVRMRAAVVDATGEVVASIDTTRGFLTGRALLPQDHLLGRLPITVPPGRYRVRIALEADGLGMLSRRMTVDIPPPDGPRLALSDLVLGTRTVRLPWRTATGDTAWVNPLRTFTPRDPLELYFEVLGLAAGTSYRVDLAVIRVSGRDAITAESDRIVESGGTPALTLGFDQRHAGGVAGVSREVSLARLRPGEYVLEVTVRGADGATAVRRQPFLIGR